MRIKGRQRRHKRITKKMKGTSQMPRLVVFRSSKHVYAQLLDDTAHKVITTFSTVHKEFKTNEKKISGQEAAKIVGKSLAQVAVKAGIKNVCFDRAGYKYHGRVRALAEGAREGGLEF